MPKVTITEVVIPTKTYNITFTAEEYKLFCEGIGNTSFYTRMTAGMTEEQSKFFVDFYSALYDAQLAATLEERS